MSSQGKEVGEPQEKKVRTLLENEEEDEEGLDEEPEEVIVFSSNLSSASCSLNSFFQWIQVT